MASRRQWQRGKLADAGTTRVSGDPLSPAGVADTDWQIAAIADLNRDGRPDLSYGST